MKKIYLLFAAVTILISNITAQTVQYSEDFESAPYNITTTTTGSIDWGLTSTYYSQGTHSYYSVVEQNDTSIMTTTTIDCSGNNFVSLEFDHICKIFTLDAGEIFVSADNGNNWTQLTSAHYIGTSQFVNQGNKFTSSSYPTIWDPSNPTTMNNNTWWQTENFDISAIAANSSQVKIKFVLRDANGSGSMAYLGWFVDNIKVTVAIDELIPPVITLINPYPHDTVYSAGPFTVKADVTDASGIDSVKLIYTHNTNPPVTVQMTYLSGNTYTASIPSIVLDDSVCYHVYAVDSSLVRNTSVNPSSGCIKFVYKTSPPPPGCSSPILSFPYSENFDGSTSSFPTGWQMINSSTFQWDPNTGGTPTSNTGPSMDHTSGSGVYAYTESSYGGAGDSTMLITPCMDIRTLSAPKLKFWYHMYGSNMGTLAVDVFYGNGYIHDIWTMTGDQGDQWKMAVVDLTPYKSITEIRFRGLRGSGGYGDMAIDDILVYDPPSNDAGIASIDAPSSPGATGVQNVEVSLENGGSQPLTSADIYWEVGGVAQTTFNWAGTLPAGDTIHNLTIGTYNFVVGPTNIKAWSANPNGFGDTYPINDTTSKTVMVCGGGLSGTYTIGGGSGDYNTITEAVDAMKSCGVSGPVIFDINTGTYTEQIRIPKILGASATNTITFQSATGDSSDVMITYFPSSTNNYIILLDSAEYITFSKLSFQPTNPSYASSFELRGIATHNTITNCCILSTGNNGNSMSIYSRASNVNYNTFSNNYIKSGSKAFYLHSVSSSSIAYKNQIINNVIDSFYLYGIYAYGQDSIKIKNNTVISADGTGGGGGPVPGSLYGIYTYYCDNDIEIANNNILLTSPSSCYGIYFYYTNGNALNPNKIYNNMIALHQYSTNTHEAIRMYYSNYNNFYYNTLYTNSASTSTSNAIVYMYGSSTTHNANNNFKNNIFYAKNNGYTVYCSNTAYCTSTFDYNTLFTNNSNLAYWGVNKIDLTAWQSSGFGANSISVDPNFTNLPDLHCKNTMINAAGTPFSGYDYDIDGDARNATTPDMGADEFDPPSEDAAITELVSPIAPCDGSTENINVRLSSYGQNALNSVAIHWSINGTPQTAFNFGGTLNTNEDTILTIGTYTFNSGTSYDIKVYSSNPNSLPDEDNSNDTLLVTGVETAMSGGTYTIDPGQPVSSTNYQTFDAAITDLVNKGLCSSVVFNVASGTYNEQIGVEEIRGTSPSVTVTFQSATGDSTDVIVTYTPTSSTNNYTLAFDKASYLTFKNMTFASGGTTYGRIVYFQNEANNINIENCEIKGSGINSSSTNFSGIYTLSNANCHHLTIKNNYIYGSSYAFYIYSGNYNTIENNNVNSYYYGIYSYYQTNLKVKNNKITFSTPAYSTNYGIRNYQVSSFEITGNEISFNGTSSNYAMYFYYASDGLIANNFIIQNGALTSTNRMIYLSSYCINLNFIHNSVLMEATSPSTSSVCFYNSSSSSTGINVINNIFANTGGTGYAYYNISTISIDTSDYNLYYTTGSLFAYWGGAQANLSALQSSNGKDQHSLSSNPNFIANTNLHIANSAAGDAGLAISYVNTDIDGETRSATTPDIGADEFEPPLVDAGAFAVLSPSGMQNTGVNIPFRIAFKNMGLNDITNINITYVLNGGTPVSQAWSGTLAYGDTTSLIIANDQLIGGTNTIKTYTTLSGDNFAYNDTLTAECFGLYPLKLYFNDFETVTNDWVPAANSVLWDLGTPTMTTINYAYSGNNVWATRLTGAYFNNRTEYLYSPQFSFLLLNNLQIGLYHWMKTEAGVDGGYLEYTKDGGTSWLRVGYTGDPNGFNWYDGVSGTTGGYAWLYDTEEWEASVYDFSNELPIYPQVQFRLAFESSPSNTSDGWAVDNFGIYVPKVDKDASAISINSPNGTTQLVPGTSQTVSITIHNPGLDTLYSIPVSYQAMNTGMPPMNGTWTGTLLPDSTANYTFSIPFNIPGIASFKLCAFTRLSLDYHPFNDTVCTTIETTLGLNDGDMSGLNLWQNSPNPASKYTTITYQIPQQGDVRFEIINTLGQLMNSLEIPEQISGKHSIEINVSTLRSGIYYIRMLYNNQSLSTKMIIAR